jgi:lipoic acid synthetase
MINTEDKKQGVKLRNEDKLSRIPIKVVPLAEPLKKPEWIKVKLPTGENFNRVKNLLREHKLHTVCEEASCPNIGECFKEIIQEV